MDQVISVYKRISHLNQVSKFFIGSFLILLFCLTFIDLQPFLNHFPITSNYTTSTFWSNLSRLRARLGTNQSMTKIGDMNYDTQRCDLLDGSWVHDGNSYPLYRSQHCPFIDEAFRCQENGRLDEDYMRWRWQPSKCNIPRFNASRVLELLKGKRMVFVGDSIGRNQWESMLCMLASGVHDEVGKQRIHEVNGEPITKHKGFLSFRFPDHDNLTVEYYRSPYLVPQGTPPPNSPTNVSCTIRVDIMDWTSPKWIGADFLIFNSGHWWTFSKIMRMGCYFQIGDQANTSMEIQDGFKFAMRTWRKWVATELDTEKTKVVFRTYAPTHFSGGLWNTGGQCDKETQPLTMRTKFENEHWTKKYVVFETEHLRGMGVQILDITGMSNYRKDAHCSIYTRVEKPLSMNNQDCSHWCLPGLPDIWNELLFISLFS